MTPLEQVKILAKALRDIGQIAVEPGADAMPALLEAQKIADEARREAGLEPPTMKIAKLKDVSEE